MSVLNFHSLGQFSVMTRTLICVRSKICAHKNSHLGKWASAPPAYLQRLWALQHFHIYFWLFAKYVGTFETTAARIIWLMFAHSLPRIFARHTFLRAYKFPPKNQQIKESCVIHMWRSARINWPIGERPEHKAHFYMYKNLHHDGKKIAICFNYLCVRTRLPAGHCVGACSVFAPRK